jgi:hypothetical protein
VVRKAINDLAAKPSICVPNGINGLAQIRKTFALRPVEERRPALK